jgi:antitoxin MazE
MAHVIVGKWGKNLAIRIPFDIARASALIDGEEVEIENIGGDILIRRPAARARNRQAAGDAAAEIIADSRSHTLGDVSLRELREEGRGE